MADELDDGELWLPSNIFSDVGLTDQRANAVTADDELSDVGVLNRQLAAFGLLHRLQFPMPPPPLPSRASSCSSSSVHHPYPPRHLTQTSPPSRRVVLHSPLSHVQRAPMAAFIRPRVLQQQQQWLTAAAGARVLPPVRPVIAGGGRTGKGCTGTGVFLPRVSVDVSKKKPRSTAAAAVRRSAEQQQQEEMRAAAAAAAAEGMSISPPPPLYYHHQLPNPSSSRDGY